MKELDELKKLHNHSQVRTGVTYQAITVLDALAAEQERLAQRVAFLEGGTTTQGRTMEPAPAEPSEEDVNEVADYLNRSLHEKYVDRARHILASCISRGWTPPRPK